MKHWDRRLQSRQSGWRTCSRVLSAGVYFGFSSGTGTPLHSLTDLIELTYASVADPSRWTTLLEALLDAVNAPKGTLLLLDSDREEYSVSCRCGWSDEEIAAYFHRYGAIDPWRIGIAPWPEGTVLADYELWPREEVEASESFREFYAPSGAIHGMGGIILVNSAGQSAVAMVRGAAAGPFGEKEKAVLRPLLPHLKRAASLHGELGALRAQQATFTGHLERDPRPFLLIDAGHRVLYANGAARAAALNDSMAIANGRFLLKSPGQQRVFEQAVAELIRTRSSEPKHLKLRRSSGRRPHRLIIMAAADSGAVPLGVSQPAVAVLLVDPDISSAPSPELLRELFSLTPAEALVATKLAQGRDVQEIAEETGVTVDTIRTHLKRTFSKTATSRQGELISLILRSTNHFRP